MSDSLIPQLSLGEKVRNFRKRAGLSQLELETAIAASPGSVSRIEAGKVNPTKETILQLGKVLKLTEKELADLMNVRPLFPTQEEIELAIAETGNLLEREDIFAYLIDENSIVYAVSKGFMKLLKIDEDKLSTLLGKPILEIAFDPTFGIFKYLDWKKTIPAAAVEIARISRYPHSVASFLRNKFKQLPHYPELFKQSQTVSYEDTVTARTLKVYFNIDGEKLEFYYAKENLRINFRFGIVEFYK